MTVLKQLLKKVSLTGQWQFWSSSFKKCHWPVNDRFHRDPPVMCTFRKCHWPVNDSFQMDHQKSVIDWSMTVLRHQCCQYLWPSVIDSSQWHKIYGHLSLTAVNDRNLWPNMAKIVIDRGQWQKKVSLTGCILYMGRFGLVGLVW